jgi:hypothetical protein
VPAGFAVLVPLVPVEFAVVAPLPAVPAPAGCAPLLASVSSCSASARSIDAWVPSTLAPVSAPTLIVGVAPVPPPEADCAPPELAPVAPTLLVGALAVADDPALRLRLSMRAINASMSGRSEISCCR